MQDYFRREFWQNKQADQVCEQWCNVVATLEQVDSAQTFMIERWLCETCCGEWAWKAVIATYNTVQITFFFERPSDAILFRLTFI
jgi:hypothetical protein